MEHGRVTSVTYDKGVVKCDVEAIRVTTEYEDLPVIRPFSGFIQMPEQGMKVAMDKLDDGTRFIRGVIAKEESHPSEMNEGDMTVQVDEDTFIHFEKREDGKYNLRLGASGDIFVENTDKAGVLNIESSGNQASVNVTASGNQGSVSVSSGSGGISVNGGKGVISVSTNSEGNVVIDGIDFDQHVHDENGDGGGTTDPPK